MKRFCRSFLGPVVLGALLAACHSDSKPSTPVASNPASPRPPAETLVTPGPVGGSYCLYRGQLPGAADSLTLHLVATTKVINADAQSVFAIYAGADGHPY